MSLGGVPIPGINKDIAQVVEVLTRKTTTKRVSYDYNQILNILLEAECMFLL